MMMGSLEVVFDAKAILGEGPSWDAINNRLLWVDIEGHQLHIHYPENGHNEVYTLNEQIGAVVPFLQDEVIVALYTGFHKYQLSTGTLTLISNPEGHLPNNRFNDGKCDPQGRFWAGTMSQDGSIAAGFLYCLDHDLTVRKVLEGISTSNGLGWSADGTHMYYIDTPTRQVDILDYNQETGSVSNRRMAFKLPAGAGYPDGMTMDIEGMLWIAEWDGGRVGRWNPQTGELLGSIAIPAGHVTSCVFGGGFLDELFITTARIGLNNEILDELPLSGSLFRIKLGVKGQPTYPYISY
ncbi:sugar lactone lactonase YvrE [Paenibacillus sp. DS2015]|uniref:SMP-30/gluconolactonase/LRE family protein n=1 Tax=Paenibacillus sp. DS2015 TaxID=3373917 RepID=UPI003D23C0FD